MSETQTLLSIMTTQPTQRRAYLIDRLIRSLKISGIWNSLDMLYILGAHDSQAARLNWVNPSIRALTATNSPTFTTDRGYTGDGASAHLTTGIAWNSLNKFSQNSAHIGAWALTAGSTNRYLIGSDQGGTLNFIQNNLSAATERSMRMNNNTTILSTDDNITTGHVVAVRRESTTQYSYRNGTSEASGACTSAASNTFIITLLRTNTVYSDAQLFAAHFGSQLSAVEVSAFYNAILAYKTAVGA